MNSKPWRDVVTPHQDVARGRYRQAEFAADLAQVLSGRAEPEYQDPVEFYQRTYITDGMKSLLVAGLERVSKKGGEPVVQLKTAFGGGKTHTMLSLYHLLGGNAPADRLSGVKEILKTANIDSLPKASLAVLVGTALDPTKPRKHPSLKGKEVRTLWGEMAAQIGGIEGYALVESADTSGVAPGADTLVEFFDEFGPCVILIDELVAYARNIYGATGLPAGSFDSNMTFVQSLTEAVKRSRRSLVVATIPESNIEIGGEAGKATLDRLENTFGRLEAVWKPVGALEGFEIVRRRLFSPIKDETARDEVCSAFSRMYADGGTDFPQECKEGTYLERLRAAYPIHPDVFDRLYDDWSTLERFQKTRGVLRLMAAAIHELWVRGDKSLLILPGSIPVEAQKVRDELTRYLPDGWNTVVDKDVDGDRSEPYRIDNQNPRLGQVMAARRVARTIFLGSAPSVRDQRVRGIEDVRIRLGVVQPGESIAVFNDALARLLDRLTHLYGGNRRFWYDLPPNLRRTVEDRASRLEAAEVEAEIERRLRGVADSERGRRRERDQDLFRGIHTCPAGSGDVPDEQEARLVVLSPTRGHKNNRKDSPALDAAAEILERRGTAARQFRNMLVFVCPDEELTESLSQEVRRFLGWKSIVGDAEALNLDAHQRRLATESQSRSDETVQVRLHEAYCWLLVPTQEGTGPIAWEATRIAGGNETYIAKASKKLRSAEQIITRWSPALLKMELGRWLWNDQPHIELKKLWEYFTSYCYLPRLRDSEVLLDAIREGIRGRDYFGYAMSVGQQGRYEGLQFGSAGGTVYLDATSALVRPEVAQQQAMAEQPAQATPYQPAAQGQSAAAGAGQVAEPSLGADSWPTATLPTRFHGSVALDAARIGRDAGRIAEEVVQHLNGLMNAKVQVTLEIHADVPEGVPDNAVRTITENCRTLRFKSHGFEKE
jgi:predicted AAA+ superfamily ATPase